VPGGGGPADTFLSSTVDYTSPLSVTVCILIPKTSRDDNVVMTTDRRGLVLLLASLPTAISYQVRVCETVVPKVDKDILESRGRFFLHGFLRCTS
jgi:hypothetical protein